MNPDRPRLSVVVASYNAPTTLERCLESLAAQLSPGDEIIVADCSSRDPRSGATRAFPSVRFVRFEQPLTIPALRREGLRVAGGEIIALTEGRVVPSNGWAAALIEAHSTHPQAPAVGGPIDSSPATAFDAAVFLCEYGRHMPPTGDGEAGELSGANLSYKRWAIELCQDLVEAGAWEPFLNRRLKQKGHRLLRAGRAVVWYHNSLAAGQFLRQRFHYGRWFAAARVDGAGVVKKLAWAAFCPLLPLLLTWRLARVVGQRRRHRRAFARALPWILGFQAVWSAGELCGYVLGKGSSDRRVF